MTLYKLYFVNSTHPSGYALYSITPLRHFQIQPSWWRWSMKLEV